MTDEQIGSTKRLVEKLEDWAIGLDEINKPDSAMMLREAAKRLREADKSEVVAEEEWIMPGRQVAIREDVWFTPTLAIDDWRQGLTRHNPHLPDTVPATFTITRRKEEA